jgi:thiosulfate dehydrogenase
MTRKWLFLSSLLFIGVVIWFLQKKKTAKQREIHLSPSAISHKQVMWSAPDSNMIPDNETGELIRYGKKLIRATGHYFGPKGSINPNANGMNCENCHMDAGTRVWAGNFGAVAALYQSSATAGEQSKP